MHDRIALNEQPPLRHYLEVLRRQAWLIVLVTVVALATAALATAFQTPVYRASLGIVVGQGGGVFQPEFGGSVEPFTLTMSSLLRTNVVAAGVIRNLRLDETPEGLLADVEVRSRPASSVLQVSYDSTNKEQAVIVLREVGRVFARLVDERIGAGARGEGRAARDGTVGITARVFDPVHLQPGRVAPKPVKNLAFAGALALALGLVLAFVRESLDDRIRRREDAAKWFGAPVIGTLPSNVHAKPHAVLTGRHRRETFEALQLLRAKLQFSPSAVSGPLIVVTSAQEEEGKSTVVANVGFALATAGKDVICVGADLHRPRLHEYLGLPSGHPGLADVLNGRTSLHQALQDVSLGAVALGDLAGRSRRWSLAREDATSDGTSSLGAPPGWGRLRAITAGRLDVTPPRPLDEQRVAELFSIMRATADYVIFDSPPVLLVGDAFPLLVAADSVIVVARRGRTTRGAAEAVRVTLDGLHIERLSVVLTDSDEREGGYGAGYYGTTLGYPRSPEESGVV